MKPATYHIQFNIDFKKNKQFYQDWFAFMEWDVIWIGDNIVGFRNEGSMDLWFAGAEKKEIQDYDQVGFNHFALRVQAEKEVDAMADFLKGKGVEMLFDTPKHRPDFSTGEEDTYYQIMFETPDKILVEAVYIGKKA